VCLLLVCIAGIAALERDAEAISSSLFDRPRERALGLDPTGVSLWRGAPGGSSGTSFRCEAGEWRLYGVDGLRVHAAVAEAGRRGWSVRLSAAVLDAPVGQESEFAAGVTLALAERIRIGGTVEWETASLEGCESASVAALSVSALVRLADRAALVTRASNIRLAGEASPGAGVSIGAVLSPESTLSAVASFSVSPAGGASFRAASRIELGSYVLFSLGYEGDTGSLDASVWIRLGGLGLDAGSSFHPVLGVSHGVFVSWGRGW
jgi:hypothetical protein